MELEDHQIKEAKQMYVKFKIDKARFPNEDVKFGEETNE